jgi:hypothetical protein
MGAGRSAIMGWVTMTDKSECRVLNLGCGELYAEDAVNVDLFAKRVDVRFDLNVMPYPFEANRFIEIRCMNVIEHLDDVLSVMAELHRVAADGASIKIRVPHFRSACLYEDITHKRGFAWKSFDLFTDQGTIYGEYSDAKFRIIGRRYTPYLLPFLYRWLSAVPVLTDNLLSKYFPMASIEFELEVVKS